MRIASSERKQLCSTVHQLKDGAGTFRKGRTRTASIEEGTLLFISLEQRPEHHSNVTSDDNRALYRAHIYVARNNLLELRDLRKSHYPKRKGPRNSVRVKTSLFMQGVSIRTNLVIVFRFNIYIKE